MLIIRYKDKETRSSITRIIEFIAAILGREVLNSRKNRKPCTGYRISSFIGVSNTGREQICRSKELKHLKRFS